MSIKVKVNMDKGKINALSKGAIKAVAMTAEQLRTELIQAQVVPFDEGTLQNVQTYIDTKALKSGQIKIVHNVPYAARVYYGTHFNFQTTTNANAQAEWWEPWISGSKRKRPSQLFKAFYKQVTGVD